MFRWGLAAGQMISPSPSMMADGTWAKLKTQSSCQLNVSQRWLLSFKLLPLSLWFVEALILIICLASIWGYKKGAEHQDWHLGSWLLEKVYGWSLSHSNRIVALISGISHPRFCPDRGGGDWRWFNGTSCRSPKHQEARNTLLLPKHVVFSQFSCQIQPNSSNMTSKYISN